MPSSFRRVTVALREHAYSPRQVYLLMRLVSWALFLRALKPFMGTQSLLKLVAPSNLERVDTSIQSSDVVFWIRQFKRLDPFSLSDKSCLVDALVCYRFLTIAGKQPGLIIGFDGPAGHAWVEVDGIPQMESQHRAERFRRVLTVSPGNQHFDKLS